jgi:RecB family endonuclease NucS
MIERDMEDLIAGYPDDFFPNKGFELTGRQESFAGVGRFDLLFEDRFKTKILMELKAIPARYEVATQLAKYKDELRRRGEDHIVMWLVSTQLIGRFGFRSESFGLSI